ncbi:MAG: CarD family transcriptional regulator, partial [Clostridia bacterium]
MFNVNDTVVYGTAGVCVVSEVKEMAVRGTERAYYVLSPVDSTASRVFVPVENENLTAKMKRIMSRDEADSMLKDKTQYVPWIEDRRERSEKYSQIISGGDKREILSVLRVLYDAKIKAESAGKKQ